MDEYEEIKTAKELVRALMVREERCRNDDEYLCERIKQIKPSIKFGTTIRCRCFIQNVEKMLQPTSLEVVERRRKRQMCFREEFR